MKREMSTVVSDEIDRARLIIDMTGERSEEECWRSLLRSHEAISKNRRNDCKYLEVSCAMKSRDEMTIAIHEQNNDICHEAMTAGGLATIIEYDQTEASMSTAGARLCRRLDDRRQ